MSGDRLAGLPEFLRATAIVVDDGRVLWPFLMAGQAIEQLANRKCVIVEVGARDPDDGSPDKAVALCQFEPTGAPADVERSRQQAQAALRRAEELTGSQTALIALTWFPPER